MDGFKNFSLPAWVSLSADIVPLSWRGRYFSTRNLAMSVAAMVFIYGIGQLITSVGEPQGYQWALSLAGILGLISAIFYSRIRDYRDENHEIQKQSYKIKSLFTILQTDQNFLAFCIFTTFWTFSLNLAGPFLMCF